MRNSWNFHGAGEIIFGNGSITDLNSIVEKLNSSRTVIITDQGIVKAGILEKATEALSDINGELLIFDQAVPEPKEVDVLHCISEIKDFQPELFIALGGGSCIDLTKIVSVLLTYGGSPSDYYGENKVPGSIIPIIAVPTTAGTGSEVSAVAVVTDEKTNLKNGLSDNKLRPVVALFDPNLLVKLPSSVTKVTGLDCLSHAIEAYFAKDYRYTTGEEPLIYQGSHPLSDVFAEKGVELVSKNLPITTHHGDNIQARTNMMLGNLYSGLAISHAGSSLSHALSYPIAEKSNRPHGEIIGLLLPYTMKYNSVVCPERFARLSEIMIGPLPNMTTDEKIDAGIDFIFKLLEDLEMPSKLSMIGIKESDIPEIAEETLKIKRLLRVNPRTPTVESLETYLRAAL